MTPLRVFIGYDPRETVAYHVLAHSILARASRPVAITPLALPHLQRVYTRARDPKQTTDFSFIRFLVPHLSGYEGQSIYLDCDMLARADLHELLTTCEGPHALWVAQHHYTPKSTSKFLGQPQTAYPRKNWSSLMVFNNARCRALTPEWVNTASAMDLHRFAWLKDEEIGAVRLVWNWLVGEYPPNPSAKILHWTLGGPWFADTEHADHADEWRAEYAAMKAPCGE